MPNLNFFGPFHFNDFNVNGIYNPACRNNYTPTDANGNATPIPDLNQPGIYIWGNLFDVNEKRALLNPTDCNPVDFKYKPEKHQLIPYYVGKSKNNMYQERLTKHKDVRNAIGNSDAHKYIRLSYDYWKEFFKDKNFPVQLGTYNYYRRFINIINQTPNSIIYHNERRILQHINPTLTIDRVLNRVRKGVPIYDHPITKQLLNGQPLLDTLDQLVNGLNNFWFCFCPTNNKSLNLSDLEYNVFYSLKGKTTSRISRSTGNFKIFDLTNNSKIFKTHSTSNLLLQNEVFLGY
jgi:hypothetical protein